MLNLELEIGDWATWVGSLGTLGAFTVAFWQIHRERSARKTREAYEAQARRREHVDRVSVWVHDGNVHVNNGSGHSLHGVRVHDGKNTIAEWSHLPPGLHSRGPTDVAEGTPHVVFTDVRGDRWSRAPGAHPKLEPGAARTTSESS
ncbi:hypothetical protein [Gordonia sp. (in: high G+C Gram-positive bacteria)]|uniref:hypothetical protein n=1 Tax=Gordonia sp. (in: high G+C Gram-positive bacteria) TaxID=84139 RepID=UPI003C781260